MAAECIGAKEDAHEADDAPEDEFEVTLESLLAAAPGFAQRVTLALCLSNASDAVETLSLGFALPFLSWDWQGLVAASVFLGMLAGGCLAGYLTETYGPKRLLVQMLYLEAVAALATSGVGGPWQLAGGRFVSGLAIGAAVPPIFGLAEELLFPRQRRLRSLSLIASSFIFGSLLVSLLAWLCLANNLGWRVFYACTGVVPMLNAALVSSWVPESPSFLQRQGRRAELVLELRRLAPNGAFDVAGMAGGAFKVAQEANHLPSEEVPGLKPLLQWPLRPVALRLGTICFSIAFAWYGLSTWLLKLFEEVGLEHRYLAAVAYALSGVPGCVASVLLLRCLQPWRLLAFWLLCTSLSCLSISLIESGAQGPLLAAACVCFFNSVSTGVFNVLTTVWGAPFSPSLRPFALGALSVALRVGSICAQFVDSALLSSHKVPEMTLLPAVLLVLSAAACFGIA